MDENKAEQEQSTGGAPDSEKKRKKLPRWLLAAALGILLLIVALAALLFTKLAKEGAAPSDQLPPPESFTVDLTKIATPIDIPLVTQGQANVDGITVSPKASYAIFNPVLRQIEIGFFRAPLSKEILEQLVRSESFSDLAQAAPDILMVVALKKNMSACDVAAIQGYQIFINKNPQAAPEFVPLEFADASGIASFGCRVETPGAVYAGLRNESVQQTETGQLVKISWDLRTSAPMWAVQVTSKVHYDSTQAKAAVALWNKMDNVIEIGFFAEEITAPEREEIRQKKSLTAQSQKKPVVVTAIYLSKAATSLELSSIVRYGVTFYRNPAAGIEFPGPNEKEGFYYVVSHEKNEQLSALRGFLVEGEFIQGRIRHEGQKVLDQIPSKFSWDLVFDAPLVDVFSQAAPPPEKITAPAQETKKEMQGPFAQVTAGSSMLEFGTVLGLYYSAENDLAIGFYATDLTPAEKDQVVKNKLLWRYVNNKRPNLVIFLDFRKGATEASAETLNSYTAYFNRDKIGSFYFPGVHDQVSFVRQAGTFREDEVATLSGPLKDGGKVTLRMKGDQTTKGNTRFTWNLNVTPEIRQVQ